MKLSICGDVCPTLLNDYFVKGDVETLFHDVPTVLKGSDRVIVNLECAMTEADTAIPKIGPNLKASPEGIKVLKAIGVTDCAISNNHVYDFGTRGALDTMEVLRREGLGYTGFGKNYQDARKNMVIVGDGKSVAILAVCEHEYCYALEERMGARPFDVFDTMQDIRRAKQNHDFVIVLYHGGKEQSVYPSPRLRRQCLAMAENGADVVLCQHSHCIGCYEQAGDSHILYGQGNFHFVHNEDKHPHWQSGLIVQLDIRDKIAIDFVPVKVVKNGIELAKDEDKQALLALLEMQSKSLKDGSWIEGWRTFCLESASQYRKVVGEAYTAKAGNGENEFFAHYLYCEAHRDVLEELCKLSWETRIQPEG